MSKASLSPHLKAEIIDITADECPIEDSYLIDTNVLYFAYYDRYDQLGAYSLRTPKYQKQFYPKFLERLLDDGATLRIHPAVFLELLRTMERSEMGILYYAKTGKDSDRLSKEDEKNLRRAYTAEYRRIVGRLSSYARSVVKTFIFLPQSEDIEDYAFRLFRAWQNSLTDVVDAIQYADACEAALHCVLSDDSDWATCDGIRFFTANRQVLDAAKDVGSEEEHNEEEKA